MRPNHRLHAASVHCLPDALAIVCRVGEKTGALGVAYQLLGDDGLVALPWGEFDVERLAQGIYEGMDLR